MRQDAAGPTRTSGVLLILGLGGWSLRLTSGFFPGREAPLAVPHYGVSPFHRYLHRGMPRADSAAAVDSSNAEPACDSLPSKGRSAGFLGVRGFFQLRKQQSGDQLWRGRTNPCLFMPAIPTDDHHSAVNPHETMKRPFAFALEYYFPIVAFTLISHKYPRLLPTSLPRNDANARNPCKIAYV